MGAEKMLHGGVSEVRAYQECNLGAPLCGGGVDVHGQLASRHHEPGLEVASRVVGQVGNGQRQDDSRV